VTEMPSLNVRLYGTEEGPTPLRTLRAGALSAVLDAGNLRTIALGGVEAIRGIAFLVRDPNWGTYIPEITDLKVEEDSERFRVTYVARCADAEQALSYCAEIEGRADGALAFHVAATPETAFGTNRAGFVVLHGVAGIAGAPVTVQHTDGTVEESAFPELIKPSQPFFDIHTLTHTVSPGLKVTRTMEGDAFEMEDQRNWTDASFRTTSDRSRSRTPIRSPSRKRSSSGSHSPWTARCRRRRTTRRR